MKRSYQKKFKKAMKLKNERIIENLLIEISYKFKQKERTANSAFAKPGFLSTFERFWFYVTFGFAEAFRLKSPASQIVVRTKEKGRVIFFFSE